MARTNNMLVLVGILLSLRHSTCFAPGLSLATRHLTGAKKSISGFSIKSIRTRLHTPKKGCYVMAGTNLNQNLWNEAEHGKTENGTN